jgi:hypothetical protein
MWIILIFVLLKSNSSVADNTYKNNVIPMFKLKLVSTISVFEIHNWRQKYVKSSIKILKIMTLSCSLWFFLKFHMINNPKSLVLKFVTQLNKKFRDFIKCEVSLPCSQQTATDPYPMSKEWIQFISSHPISVRSSLILSSCLCLHLPSCYWWNMIKGKMYGMKQCPYLNFVYISFNSFLRNMITTKLMECS